MVLRTETKSRRYGRSRRRRRRLIMVAAGLVLAIAAVPAFQVAEENVRKAMYPLRYEETIREESAARGLEPAFVAGVVRTESRFDPEAESSQGAYGLMQMLPETARFVSKKSGIKGDYREPKVNLRLGIWYLSYLDQRYDGNERLVLAAYNSGEGQVDGWLRQGRDLDQRIPFRETHDYVNNVLKARDTYRELYGKNLKRNHD